jgi:2-keto-4-pentenoate hydratase/2-oxohepta-3-ene-1,7-dioic acid hydratase in catechol pathway
MGPCFAPRAFVPDHRLIEYASTFMTLELVIFSSLGTVGVGQGAGAFLAAGDVVETEIEGIGRRRNRVVGGSAN